MNKNFFRTSLSTVLLSSALALAGCSGTGQEAPAPATQAQGQIAPVAANAHGPVKLVGAALSQIPLRPEQRTEIEKMATEAEVRHETARKAQTDLMNAVADQVQAGAIDRTALQPKIDAAVSAAETLRPQDRAAFQRLHDLLDPTQREAFVNAMKDKMHAEHGKWGHHPHGAKDTANAAPEQATPPPAGEHEHAFGRFGQMKKMAEDLKLTDEQQSQIKDVFKAEFQKNGGAHMREAMKMRDHAGNTMEHFKDSDFSVEKEAPQVDLRAKVSEGTTHAIDIAQKILPILTPEQRTTAAQKIREHATNGGPMPF
jgi:Spy/CpxP family protein refolding chaperone